MVYKQSMQSYQDWLKSTGKMNFHFVVQTLAALSFTVRYELSRSSYQDFFIFQGNQSQAHFYRKDNVLKLYVSHMEHFNSFKIENITTNFWFSWPEFTVNDTLMTVVHQSNVKNINFTNFTFISPILEFYNPELQPIIKSLDVLSEINYNYVILIMFVVVIVIKVDVKIIVDFIKAMKVKLTFESVYISMKSLETIEPAFVPENGENQHSSNPTKSIK